jgi:hypothetical protein
MVVAKPPDACMQAMRDGERLYSTLIISREVHTNDPATRSVPQIAWTSGSRQQGCLTRRSLSRRSWRKVGIMACFWTARGLSPFRERLVVRTSVQQAFWVEGVNVLSIVCAQRWYRRSWTSYGSWQTSSMRTSGCMRVPLPGYHERPRCLPQWDGVTWESDR